MAAVAPTLRSGRCVRKTNRRRPLLLDLCAAPGGKTMQLAERAAEVVAVEIQPAGRGSRRRTSRGSASTTSPPSRPMRVRCRPSSPVRPHPRRGDRREPLRGRAARRRVRPPAPAGVPPDLSTQAPQVGLLHQAPTPLRARSRGQAPGPGCVGRPTPVSSQSSVAARRAACPQGARPGARPRDAAAGGMARS